MFFIWGGGGAKGGSLMKADWEHLEAVSGDVALSERTWHLRKARSKKRKISQQANWLHGFGKNGGSRLLFHRDRWTVCAQIEFGFNCIVAFIIYLLHRFCLQVYGVLKCVFALVPPPSAFLLFSHSHSVCLSVCVCVDVSARSFFILHYSRIKDTVIL